MKILIATHKGDVPYPTNSVYQPITVGTKLLGRPFLGTLSDAVGKNISDENHFFNELTALYWAKYNLSNEDIVGLVHYRRYFGRKHSSHLKDVLDEEEIREALKNADVILPNPRNYFIENQETHYLNAHVGEPYWVLREVLSLNYPEYLEAFENVGKSTKAHLFNMSVMKQKDFQEYTEFLFGVLFKVQAVIPLESYSGQDVRSLGFLAERLMDVWVLTKKKKVVEFPVIYTEHINWADKGWNFLKRKVSRTSTPKKVHF
ncbi:MAG: DUF4422 domain-containing protein [Lactobacillaceae bacterium]|nr:DUF4422 domain-containing protein [Lactobacillaceae bacterium]